MRADLKKLASELARNWAALAVSSRPRGLRDPRGTGREPHTGGPLSTNTACYSNHTLFRRALSSDFKASAAAL